jgi:predicted dehydrogenase
MAAVLIFFAFSLDMRYNRHKMEVRIMSLKICAIGCGDMATIGHGPAFRKYALAQPDTVLAACCDLDINRAEAFKTAFGFSRAYTDVDRMLLAEKPDAVSLMVPPAVTAQLTAKILRAGIPVILEKPPGLNRTETLDLMEVAQQTGTPNQVAFNRRYMPMIQRFQQLRQGKTDLFWQYDFYRSNRRDKDFSTTSIHGIDTVRFLAGKDYQQVEFHYYPNPIDNTLVPVITLDFAFTNGAQGRITFNPGSGICAERCLMHGSNEMIYATLPYHGSNSSMDGSGSILVAQNNQIVLREDQEEEEFFVINGFYGENAHFFDCIRSGIHPTDDIASGLQAVEIAECIRHRKSSYTAAF